MMKSMVLALAVLLLGTSSAAADAKILCTSRGGIVRIRDAACRAYETAVDVRELLAAVPDPVPLRDWSPASGPSASDSVEAGLEAVAAAGASNMSNLTPCRLVDTRPGSSSALAGDDVGALASFEIRTYTLAGFCGVPSDATALSINLAVVPGPDSGFVSVGPSGSIAAFPPGPNFASINFEGAAAPISNSLIVPLDDMGRLDVYAARSTDVILDTNGYFAPTGAGTNTVFVPGTDAPTDNGTALKAAVTEINASAAGSIWTLELGPGVFDLGSTGITLERPTTLVGAGQHATMVTCACSGDLLTHRANGIEVRSLHVDNSDSSGNARGIVLDDVVDQLIQDTYVTTAGNDGIDTESGTVNGLLIDGVIVEAEDVAVDAGINDTFVIRNSDLHSAGFDVVQLSGGGTLTIENSTLETSSGTQPGIHIFGGDAIVRHSRIITGGSPYAQGTSGSLLMTHTFVDAGSENMTGTSVETCLGTTTPSTSHGLGCP